MGRDHRHVIPDGVRSPVSRRFGIFAAAIGLRRRRGLGLARSRSRIALRASGLTMWCAAIVGPAAATPPQRIVSLNVCIDQILVDLVPRERIAALTHLATDPLSVAVPDQAIGIRQTRGTAEAVLAVDPDLILAGAWTTTATVHLLRRLGRRVEIVEQPDTIAGVRDIIGRIGTLVDSKAAADRLVADLDRRLAAVAPPEGPRPRALVYQPNDYVSSTESLIGEALARAGFADGAASLRRARSGRVAIETLVLAKPDLLVLATGPTTYKTAVADNLRHPVLADIAARTQTIVIPWPLWLCGTHHIATAVERLAAARGGR
jgi:iron complex transport system substrate-binding protein